MTEKTKACERMKEIMQKIIIVGLGDDANKSLFQSLIHDHFMVMATAVRPCLI
jgi:hypothetical protein